MDWNLRTSVKEDVPAIEKLFTEMLNTIYHRDGTETYEAGYLDKFYENEGDRICVAESEGKVIGYLSIELHREDESFLYLDDFSVTATRRGCGIGHGLLEKVIEYAQERGIGSIYLHVEKENIGAQRLYRSFGFDNFADEGSRVKMLKRI